MKLKALPLAIALSLLITGCNFFQPQEQLEIQQQAEETVNQFENNQTNPLTSLRDAILAGQAMSCTYTDDQGSTVTTLVQGQKLKAEGIVTGENNQRGHMVSDGTWMYMWSAGETKGMKFNINDFKDQAPTGSSPSDYQNPEDWANEIDQNYQVDCVPATANAADFVPPTDVEFTDLNSIIQNMQQNMEMDPEAIGKMMQQYQP